MDMGYCGKLYMVRESVPSAERARVSKKELWEIVDLPSFTCCCENKCRLKQRLRLPVFILQIVSTHELEETDNVKHWVTSKKKTLVLTNINQCQQGCQLILWPTFIMGCFINYNWNQKLVSLTYVVLHLSNLPK